MTLILWKIQHISWLRIKLKLIELKRLLYYFLVASITTIAAVICIVILDENKTFFRKFKYFSIILVFGVYLIIFSAGVLRLKHQSYLKAFLSGLLTSGFSVITITSAVIIAEIINRGRFTGKWDKVAIVALIIFGTLSIVSSLIPFIAKRYWTVSKKIDDNILDRM